MELLLCGIILGVLGVLVVQRLRYRARLRKPASAYTDAAVDAVIEEIRKRCGMPGNAISVANAMGISVYAALFEGSNVLVKTEDTKGGRIYINANTQVPERRNAIARAIGYILLDKKVDGVVRKHVEHFRQDPDMRAIHAQKIADFVLSGG